MTNERLERCNKIQESLTALDSLWQNTLTPMLFFGNDTSYKQAEVTYLHSFDEETKTILLKTIQDIIKNRREELNKEFESL